MNTNRFLIFRKRIISIIMAVVVVLSASLLAACTNQENTERSNEPESQVRAADPMTEEEMEADDTDGCIEDSKDLLY